MKILINALSALRGGGQTYLINLLTEFNNLKLDCLLIVIVNSKNYHIFEKFHSTNIQVIESKFASHNVLFRFAWEILYLPIYLKINSVNSYFAPGGIMVSIMPKGCKSFTALRNMLPFDEKERSRFPLFSYIRFKLWLLKHLFLVSYKMSNKVIFISKYSMEEVSKYIPSVKYKSKIIYHGVNHNFKYNNDSNSILPDGLVKNEYYLYVSILDVYKAQKQVVEEWLEMNSNGNQLPLVLVGPVYNNYGEYVVNKIRSSKATNIIYLGEVDYNDLPQLYQKARALICVIMRVLS